LLSCSSSSLGSSLGSFLFYVRRITILSDQIEIMILRIRSRSGALTAALVGLGVVVAALLADPVADQVLGALELLRPGVASDKTRGLPHHVELAVGFDFANEHRLGDVMVWQHLGGAA